MSTGTIPLIGERRSVQNRVGIVTKLLAYVELTKPKISVMVLMVVTVAFYLGKPLPTNYWLLLPTLVGTALVAASASTWNQWLEQHLDSRMERTVSRPLPSGLLSNIEVLCFGIVTLLLGTAVLAFQVNWQAAFCGLATWGMYVWIYTPLKTRSTTNTAIGAVAGALPVMIGAAAADATFSLNNMGVRLLTLFLILFLWQFPHFMAIAWIYRHDYGRGGMKMLTVVDPTGQRAGLFAIRTSIVMIPLSMLPLVFSKDILLVGICLSAGLMYAYYSIRFCQSPNDRTARSLLRGSLVYLPVFMGVLLFAPSY
jgi:protoheme IX farnesyltransferase